MLNTETGRALGEVVAKSAERVEHPVSRMVDINFEISRYRYVRHIKYSHTLDMVKIQGAVTRKLCSFGPISTGRNPGIE
jgi:hypothetical protein